MKAANDCILLMNTCPDAQVADKIASMLIEKRHAACVNCIANITSTYRWQGQIVKDREYLLLIKSTQAQFSAIQELIVANHPYELPEIVAVPMSAGLDAYLAWINDSVES